MAVVTIRTRKKDTPGWGLPWIVIEQPIYGERCGNIFDLDACCRLIGHPDDAWPQNIHVSYDSGRYRQWPVRPRRDLFERGVTPY